MHVTPGIDPDRAAFAKDARLWERLPQFAPECEAVPRARICTGLGLENDDFSATATRECFIASIGHPDVAGARRYADSIWATLEPRLEKL